MRLKKIKVDETAPKPNKYRSLGFIFSEATFAEKTPDQNTIVNGLEAVKTIPLIKARLGSDGLENNLMLGKNFRLNAAIPIFNPNRNNIKEPKYFKTFLTLSFSRKEAIPNKAKRIYRASIKTTAKTPVSPLKKPDEVAMLNMNAHTGPTAICNSIPNLKPLNMIAYPPKFFLITLSGNAPLRFPACTTSLGKDFGKSSLFTLEKRLMEPFQRVISTLFDTISYTYNGPTQLPRYPPGLF
jgi:hypothetical protein